LRGSPPERRALPVMTVCD